MGYGATSDAYHITSPAEDGMGAAMAMKNAVKDAGVALESHHFRKNRSFALSGMFQFF